MVKVIDVLHDKSLQVRCLLEVRDVERNLFNDLRIQVLIVVNACRINLKALIFLAIFGVCLVEIRPGRLLHFLLVWVEFAGFCFHVDLDGLGFAHLVPRTVLSLQEQKLHLSF